MYITSTTKANFNTTNTKGGDPQSCSDIPVTFTADGQLDGFANDPCVQGALADLKKLGCALGEIDWTPASFTVNAKCAIGQPSIVLNCAA